MVACKMTFCPFFCAGVCEKPVLTIDENGHCEEIWRKGQAKRCFESIDDIYKKKNAEILIEDIKTISNEECK